MRSSERSACTVRRSGTLEIQYARAGDAGRPALLCAASLPPSTIEGAAHSMTEFQVDAAALRAEAPAVAALRGPLDAAQTAVAAAGSAAGVAGHELVAQGLQSYATWWTQAISGLSSSAGVIADQLTATADDYAAADDRVRGLLDGTGGARAVPPSSAGGAYAQRLGGPQ